MKLENLSFIRENARLDFECLLDKAHKKHSFSHGCLTIY